MKLALLLILVVVSSLFTLPVHASAVEKFPTSTTEIVAGWMSPERAYTPNFDYAYVDLIDGAEQEYDGFNFTIPSDATIDLVYAKVLFSINPIVDFPDDFGACQFSMKVYNGSDWQTWLLFDSACALTSDEVGEEASAALSNLYYSLGFNVTAFLNTPAKVNASKLRILYTIVDATTGMACYIDVVNLEVAYSATTESEFPVGLGAGALLMGFVAVIAFSIKKRR